MRILDPDQPAPRIQSSTGNQAMNMWMKSHLLVPGMEHGGKAIDLGPESFVGGQLFGKCSRDCREEQVIGLPGVRTKERAAQLGGQGEGDQEIRSVDEFGQFALHPAAGGSGATLRAGLVIAGMPGEADLVAILTDKGPPAQGRSAAMSDGPKGAALRGAKRRSRLEEVRQKLTQRPQHGGSHATTRWMTQRL